MDVCYQLLVHKGCRGRWAVGLIFLGILRHLVLLNPRQKRSFPLKAVQKFSLK